MMRAIFVFLIVVFFSESALACRPAYLQLVLHFQAASTDIPVDQVRRTIEWRDNTRRAFPAGFETFVTIWAAEGSVISEEIAERRASNLRSLLLNLGIPAQDIEEMDVVNRNQKIEDSYDLNFINEATIEINPRCPHPCCPGPEPINKP